MTGLAYGSLCTGYDGIGMGLAFAGLDLEHRFVAEVEPSVSAVLAAELPGVPNAGDIKAAPWHLAPRCDVWSSGDPCQAISIAGRQAGREDPRFLWPWVRVAYRAARPSVIFFENVANIVSHDGGRTLAERFENLREDGYEVRWGVIGACAVGAPHHRHRWYAVAVYRGPGRVSYAVRADGGKAVCDAPRGGTRVLLPTPNARDGGSRGSPSREHAQRRADNPLRSLNLEDAAVLLPEGWGRYAPAIALWEGVTGNPAPAPTVPGPNGGVRLNPELPEWMMGLRPGLLTGRMSRNDALRAAGNGVVPLAAAVAWKMLTAKQGA